MKKEETIQAIETKYKGYKFRSRLEARYAVFLDALKIDWYYELEGYKLPTRWYLPDFYLPTFHGGSYVEVKFEFNEEEDRLCQELCAATKKDVILFEGMPDIKVYNYYTFDGEKPRLINGIPNADSAEHENRMFAMPCYENDDGTIPENYIDNMGYTFLTAVSAARSKRFEHGE